MSCIDFFSFVIDAASKLSFWIPFLVYFVFFVIAALLSLISFRLIEERKPSALVLVLTQNAIAILAIKEYFNVSEYGVNEDIVSLMFFLVFSILYITLYIVDPYYLNKVIDTQDRRKLIYYKSFFSGSLDGDKKLNDRIVNEIMHFLQFSSKKQTLAYRTIMTFNENILGEIMRFKESENKPATFQAIFSSHCYKFTQDVLKGNYNGSPNELNFKYGIFKHKINTDELELILQYSPKGIDDFSGTSLIISKSFAGYCFENKKPLVFPSDRDLTDNRWQRRDSDKTYKGFFSIPIDDTFIIIIEAGNEKSVEVLNTYRPLALIFATTSKILLDLTKEVSEE